MNRLYKKETCNSIDYIKMEIKDELNYNFFVNHIFEVKGEFEKLCPGKAMHAVWIICEINQERKLEIDKWTIEDKNRLEKIKVKIESNFRIPSTIIYWRLA